MQHAHGYLHANSACESLCPENALQETALTAAVVRVVTYLRVRMRMSEMYSCSDVCLGEENRKGRETETETETEREYSTYKLHIQKHMLCGEETIK